MPATHKSSVHAFEAYAWQCVELAGQMASPQSRDRLLDMAREWMWLREQGEVESPRVTIH